MKISEQLIRHSVAVVSRLVALSALGYEHDYRVINVWNQDSQLVREHCP